MRVGAVDIGSNSMRLLITDGDTEVGRWVEVTGLGSGIDATGMLGPAETERTLAVLKVYGERMDESGVLHRRVIATSASRDAGNREEFFDGAESALGTRPTLLSGSEEARMAFRGATLDLDNTDGLVVSDIGGGSTEFVSSTQEASIDIGTVRLTDRALPDRPATKEQMAEASALVSGLFSNLDVGSPKTVVGVAGTWTSLAAIAHCLKEPGSVHGLTLTSEALADICRDLAGMTVEETAQIPCLDPKRAPVMLAGAVIAGAAMETLEVNEVMVSERDSLDGVAADLLALA